ncbi:MAG: hypothetical protein LM589_01695 [Thermosphaera sp.]|nr:hypothetical protein [Thermosphaera sp.]
MNRPRTRRSSRRTLKSKTSNTNGDGICIEYVVRKGLYTGLNSLGRV